MQTATQHHANATPRIRGHIKQKKANLRFETVVNSMKVNKSLEHSNDANLLRGKTWHAWRGATRLNE
eukprot:3767089-Amphidinium_carterae.1